MFQPVPDGKTAKLLEEAGRRILVLDGAMGSLIKSRLESSAAIPGFSGCIDELCVLRPDLVSSVHEDYLRAGADIIETCSFNAADISLNTCGLTGQSYEISRAAAFLARKAADAYSTPDRPRFAAGAMGPTAKSAGIPLDINNPSVRAVSWEELEAAYYDQARGLLDGGVDCFLVETIVDTLNAKAAVAALLRLFGERGAEYPLLLSATVDRGGCLLTGQTAARFLDIFEYARPFSVGLNCSFGAAGLLPHIRVMAEQAPCLVSVYPNAGLPGKDGNYAETPPMMAGEMEDYFRDGLVNIAGGCCGSSPAHITAIAETAARYSPRPLPQLHGIGGGAHPGDGEYTAPYTEELRRLLREGNVEDAAELLRDESGEALYLDIDDSAQPVEELVCLASLFPEIGRKTMVVCSKRWDVIETILKRLPGKALVKYSGGDMDGPELTRRLALCGAQPL